MHDMKIRRVERHDLPQVVAMIGALAAHHDDLPQTDPEMLARDVLGDTPWVTLLVAEGTEGLAGYAALCPLVQLQFGARGMDMHHLFVTPQHRGCGLGRALIDASCQAALGLGCLYLAVGTHPDNDAAQRFYENAGFSRTSGGPRFRIRLDRAS
ncbi:GNAT family N-acetyltransferase [Sulfitobacter sp. JB4-11]|uniref:GNAT family N-acetyltransferase n=1 Tax=Sulfitobacter rhodophyticola TaxID=3238304 RepID=UPI0035122C10